MFNMENCLTVTDIKKSIEVMDEFVDGDFDFLELKNWFNVVDTKKHVFSAYDNSGQMRVSLIVAKKRLNPQAPLCEHDPTMTELRQSKHFHLFLDWDYPVDSISYSIRQACERWVKDEFIPLPYEICLRAQTSYNRMDYGCEWLGGGDWEEKTMYGETTDFFIVGIVLHEPYKHVEQEATEILADLHGRKEIAILELDRTLALLKNTEDTLLYKTKVSAPRACRAIAFTDTSVVVQFEHRTATFLFPQSYFEGFLVNSKQEKTVITAKAIHEDVQALNKEIEKLERVLTQHDFAGIHEIVWQYRNKGCEK